MIKFFKRLREGGLHVPLCVIQVLVIPSIVRLSYYCFKAKSPILALIQRENKTPSISVLNVCR